MPNFKKNPSSAMKKSAYKMKYTNGKKADTTTFPFKESPTKFYFATKEMQDSWTQAQGAQKLSRGEVPISYDHRHGSNWVEDLENSGPFGGGGASGDSAPAAPASNSYEARMRKVQA